MDCITTPVTARPAPATMAVRTCGKRTFHMMLFHVVETVYPASVRTTSSGGISTDPVAIESTATTSKSTRPVSIYVFFLAVCSLYLPAMSPSWKRIYSPFLFFPQTSSFVNAGTWKALIIFSYTWRPTSSSPLPTRNVYISMVLFSRFTSSNLSGYRSLPAK